jgi:hypothetical protein
MVVRLLAADRHGDAQAMPPLDRKREKKRDVSGAVAQDDGARLETALCRHRLGIGPLPLEALVRRARAARLELPPQRLDRPGIRMDLGRELMSLDRGAARQREPGRGGESGHASIRRRAGAAFGAVTKLS